MQPLVTKRKARLQPFQVFHGPWSKSMDMGVSKHGGTPSWVSILQRLNELWIWHTLMTLETSISTSTREKRPLKRSATSTASWLASPPSPRRAPQASKERRCRCGRCCRAQIGRSWRDPWQNIVYCLKHQTMERPGQQQETACIVLSMGNGGLTSTCGIRVMKLP